MTTTNDRFLQRTYDIEPIPVPIPRARTKWESPLDATQQYDAIRAEEARQLATIRPFGPPQVHPERDQPVVVQVKPQERNGSAMWLWLLVPLIVVVVAGIAVGLYFLLDKTSERPRPPVTVKSAFEVTYPDRAATAFPEETKRDSLKDPAEQTKIPPDQDNYWQPSRLIVHPNRGKAEN